MDDYGSPWKAALECYLPECLALLFPTVHAGNEPSNSASERNKHSSEPKNNAG
jgi:hypothetical protein